MHGGQAAPLPPSDLAALDDAAGVGATDQDVEEDHRLGHHDRPG
jgi:hypothetical protein